MWDRFTKLSSAAPRQPPFPVRRDGPSAADSRKATPPTDCSAATINPTAPVGARTSPRTGAAVVMRADANLLAAASVLIMNGPGR